MAAAGTGNRSQRWSFVKFLRTIRFDASDDHVFERSAPSDEWAVPGGFQFADQPVENLSGKARQAFANGFFSLGSFGHATLVSVADIDSDELDRLTMGLATFFIEQFGAPDEQSAMNVAQDEIGFVTEMCSDLPINTLLALSRSVDEAGAIKESFRTLDPPTGAPHARVWDVVEDANDAP